MVLNKVVFCRQYCSVYTWTNSYHGSDILVWAVIWMVYSREYLYMMMSLRFWHHLEQVWHLCWNSVRVFREHMTFCSTLQKLNRWCSSVVHINVASLYFAGSPINCVHECDLLGIPLSSNRSTDNVIEKAVMKFNIKSNEVFSDFKLLPWYRKSKLFTTFCIDAYRCQLWYFESKEVHHFYVAWRKAVHKLWRLPYTTHCNLLHTINNSLPIEISLEKRSV